MKALYRTVCAMMLTASAAFTACDDNTPFETIAPSDEPHILNPIFPDRNNGELATFANISSSDTLNIALTVTPSEFTTVKWYIDNTEVESGTESDKDLKIYLLAGTYNLKIVAETVMGKTATREGKVIVNPLAGDPATKTVAFERVVAPGVKAQLYGANLKGVTSIGFDRLEVKDAFAATKAGGLLSDVAEAKYVETEEDSYLEYTVPETLDPCDYRLVLIDNDGNVFGGDKVTVSSNALITSGAGRCSLGAEWVITGINLDKVTSLKIGDVVVDNFTSQSGTELKFPCPDVEAGDYTMSGITQSGESVMFFSNGAQVESLSVVISAERTLWAGHHYVSWELADGDPNKTFNLIPADVFASLKAGAVLSIAYSIEPTAEYHQIQPTTGWWTNLIDKVEVSASGTLSFELTQEMLDLINAQSGFLCVGHGYYVDLVTVK